MIAVMFGMALEAIGRPVLLQARRRTFLYKDLRFERPFSLVEFCRNGLPGARGAAGAVIPPQAAIALGDVGEIRNGAAAAGGRLSHALVTQPTRAVTEGAAGGEDRVVGQVVARRERRALRPADHQVAVWEIKGASQYISIGGIPGRVPLVCLQMINGSTVVSVGVHHGCDRSGLAPFTACEDIFRLSKTTTRCKVIIARGALKPSVLPSQRLWQEMRAPAMIHQRLFNREDFNEKRIW